MSEQSGLVTVGMPVCNAMPWLPEAIESLLRQTAAEFEILVIVDGGGDGSAAWLETVRDPRLRVLQQANAGVSATLNRLLCEARTPWLVRQDADDISYPQRIQNILNAIHRHPEAGLIYSLADYHPRERCAGRFRCSRGRADELRSIVESGYLLSICHSTAALNVEKAREVGGYRMDIHAEDADLWWRMALRYEIQFIPETLVGFRQSSVSVSARHAEKQQLAGLYVQYLLLSELWGLKPRPLSEAGPVLQGFLRPSWLAAKELLRSCNMHLAQGERMESMLALARAFHASPRYVLQRLRDGFRNSAIANGVAPRLFAERREALWG